MSFNQPTTHSSQQRIEKKRHGFLCRLACLLLNPEKSWGPAIWKCLKLLSESLLGAQSFLDDQQDVQQFKQPVTALLHHQESLGWARRGAFQSSSHRRRIGFEGPSTM
ncbi:hypothetical protein BSKO_07259 [Bryopsis sp. KO-2023]|nr:hypothetical protein BSKO_07259 [Bryopsis sp. KO-2023]